MKPSRKSLVSVLLFASLQCGLTSCVADGYVGADTGVYYGPRRDPWFNDGPWMDDHRGWGQPGGELNVGVYIHPPRRHR